MCVIIDKKWLAVDWPAGQLARPFFTRVHLSNTSFWIDMTVGRLIWLLAQLAGGSIRFVDRFAWWFITSWFSSYYLHISWVLGSSGCDFFHMHFWKVHFSWQLNSSGWSTRLVARLIGYWFDSFGDSILLAGGWPFVCVWWTFSLRFIVSNVWNGRSWNIFLMKIVIFSSYFIEISWNYTSYDAYRMQRD